MESCFRVEHRTYLVLSGRKGSSIRAAIVFFYRTEVLEFIFWLVDRM